jgi:hypothetical protein
VEEAVEMNPFKVAKLATESVPLNVVFPNTRKVPDADTLPLASTLKSPRRLVVDVAKYKESERSEEVVEPSVTVT